MTLPAPWRRSTAAERRANRAAFVALKAECAANPTPAMDKLRAKKRSDDVRQNAVLKMRRAIAGKGAPAFTVRMLARLKPDELMKLKAYSAGRFMALDADQRRRLSANLYVLLSTVPDDVYRAVADMLPLGEEKTT
jgi:hypothetical protein